MIANWANKSFEQIADTLGVSFFLKKGYKSWAKDQDIYSNRKAVHSEILLWQHKPEFNFDRHISIVIR